MVQKILSEKNICIYMFAGFLSLILTLTQYKVNDICFKRMLLSYRGIFREKLFILAQQVL